MIPGKKIREQLFPENVKIFTSAPEWTKWSAWSSCSQSCGGGERTRERKCSSIGVSVPIHLRWSSPGSNHRRSSRTGIRRKVNRQSKCPGNGTEVNSCGKDQCPGTFPRWKYTPAISVKLRWPQCVVKIWQYLLPIKHPFCLKLCCFFSDLDHGCELLENMGVVGEDVKTSFVQTIEECASKCSQTDLCDSFWVFTAKVNICHMKREGEFNLNPRKSAGRCTKGLLLNSPTIQI